jgi:hypothetical protein
VSALARRYGHTEGGDKLTPAQKTALLIAIQDPSNEVRSDLNAGWSRSKPVLPSTLHVLARRGLLTVHASEYGGVYGKLTVRGGEAAHTLKSER